MSAELTYDPRKLKEIQTVYPVLSEEHAIGIAVLETEFRFWHAWPHINYKPDKPLFYARRNNTQMNIIMKPTLEELRSAIEEWRKNHSYLGWGG